MSDKKNKEESGTEKVMTKYDRKMEQRRKRAEEERKSEQRSKLITAVVLIAIVAWIASYPILSYVHRNEAWIKVNGQTVTREEFDYYFSNIANSYGMDPNGDLDSQTYSETMSMKDYLEQKTVENLQTYRGILADADADGFTYDTASDVEKFEEQVKESAESAGLSVGKYVKQRYGSYAVLGDVKKYAADTARISAYMTEKEKSFRPSEEEIQTYYEENKRSLDAVDYYLQTIQAQIPEDATEEQIEAAMNKAADEADKALASVEQNGELLTGQTGYDVNSYCEDWLYDESRKSKDQTVIENKDAHVYYVLSFVDRYRKEDVTANIYAVITDKKNGQQILDEWKNGEASEASFKELVKKYDISGSADGYYENMAQDNLVGEMGDWIFSEDRKAGDAECITVEGSEAEFVIYYAGEGEVSWKADVISILSNEKQSEYEESFLNSVSYEDINEHLQYLYQSADDSDGAQSGAAEGSAVEITGESQTAESGAAEAGSEAQ